jgi:hypothetical protein
VVARETILAEKILVVRDEEEGPRAAMNLGVGYVAAKAALFLCFPDLAEAR